MNGTLPPNELLCEPDQETFPSPEFFEGQSNESAQLLADARLLSEWFSRQRFINRFGHDGLPTL